MKNAIPIQTQSSRTARDRRRRSRASSTVARRDGQRGEAGFVGRAARVARVAYQGYSLAKMLASVINTEYKHHDAVQSTTYSYSGAQIGPLCVPPQGLGDAERTGDTVRLQYTDFSWNVQNHASAAGTLTRFILFYDKQSSFSAVSDVIESAYVGTVYAPIAAREEDTIGRFKILKDFVVQTDNTGMSFASGSFKHAFPAGAEDGEHVRFAAASTTVYSGALRLIVITNINANLPTVTWFSRTFFTDN